MSRRITRALLLAVAATLLATTSASAGATFQFGVELDDGVYSTAPGGSFGVSGLNTGQTTRIVAKPPSGPARVDVIQGSSFSFYSNPFVAGLQAGDVISVYQPSGAVTPTESFTVPATNLSAQVGATTVSGTMPVGFEGGLNVARRIATDPQPYSLKAGPFTLGVPEVLPGDTFYMNLANGIDDYVSQLVHAPGETPLITASAAEGTSPPPGFPASPQNYSVEVDDLMTIVAPSVRMVVRRNGTAYIDTSSASQSVGGSSETMPLPGDLIEVYRPQGAGSPSFAVTIPQVSGRFDPSVDLVAVDAPAAGVLSVRVCRAYDCLSDNRRTVRNVPAGRTFLSFATALGEDPVLDLRNGDSVILQFTNANSTFQYETALVQGDLVAPTQKLTISSKLKLASLLKATKNGLKVKLNSNEAGSAKLTLAVGKTKLATGTATAKVGTVTVKLKFTKSGKKALKKLKAKGRKFKSQKATLTSVVTDSSGNSSTKSKSTTIKR